MLRIANESVRHKIDRYICVLNAVYGGMACFVSLISGKQTYSTSLLFEINCSAWSCLLNIRYCLLLPGVCVCVCDHRSIATQAMLQISTTQCPVLHLVYEGSINIISIITIISVIAACVCDTTPSVIVPISILQCMALIYDLLQVSILVSIMCHYANTASLLSQFINNKYISNNSIKVTIKRPNLTMEYT